MLECEKKLDHHLQLANYLREQVKKKTGFQLVVEVSDSVALWYCGGHPKGCADLAQLS